MTAEINPLAPDGLLLPDGLPLLITTAGERISVPFIEFFAATLRNPHTRAMYA